MWFYLTIKEILQFAMAEIELEGILPREISQTQEDK